VTVRNAVYIVCPSFFHKHLRRIEESPLGFRMAKGMFWSVSGAVISRGLMLMASILVARMLGREVYGEFGMVRSTVFMFATFAGFGLGITATKHVAEFRRVDPQRAGHVLVLSNLFALVTGTLVAGAILFFAPWLAIKSISAPHLVPELRIGAFILFLSGLNGAQTGALAGFEEFKSIAKVNLGVSLISFPLLIVGAYWGGLNGVVWALLFNMAVNWLLNHLALRKVTAQYGIPFSFHGCTREWPVLWKFSLPAALGGFLVSPVIWACNALLVNQPGGYSQMGLYDAANQWGAAVLFIPGMVGMVTMPMLSNLTGDKDHLSYLKVLKYNILVNGGAALVIAFPLALIAPFVMQSYGKGFAEGRWVLVCLLFSSVLVAVNNVVGQAIASRSKMWIGLLFNLLWAICLVGSCYWFLKLGYGALGLALANLVSYLLHSLWQIGYVYYLQKQIE
jgi:O-antigen/teichoic acid export membrane protein